MQRQCEASRGQDESLLYSKRTSTMFNTYYEKEFGQELYRFPASKLKLFEKEMLPPINAEENSIDHVLFKKYRILSILI